MKLICVVAIIGLAVLLLHSGDRYGGNELGWEVVPGTMVVQNWYELQMGKDGKPLFVIFWRSGNAGTSGSDSRNVVDTIHGHPISPNLGKKAVYALQRDYSLKEVALSEKEIGHILQLVTGRTDRKPLVGDDALWKEKVLPELKFVPYTSAPASRS